MASLDIEQFRNRLRIDKHNLDGELEIHSQSQERIGREIVRLEAVMARAKDHLARVEARGLEQIKESNEKMTNPQADKEVKRRPDYQQAQNEYLNAKQEHGEWEKLYDSWVSRGYGMKTLADLHGQQYYSVDTTVRVHVNEADMRAEMRRAAEAKRNARTAPPERSRPTPPDETPRVRRRLTT